MDPSLALAIFEKLTGFPFTNNQPTVDPTTGIPTNRHRSMGMRIPMPKQGVSKGALATDNPSALRLWGRGYAQTVYKPIPVYMAGPDTKKYEDVFPSLSFVESDIQVGSDPFLYRDNVGYTEGISTIINPATGYTETGPETLQQRKHANPWNSIWTFRLYSTDPIEIIWLERCFLDMWGPKGAISVERADGTFDGVDYVLERVAFFDQGEMFNSKTGIGATQPRHLSRAFTIQFETHLDNSVQGFGTHDWELPLESIQHRILEINDYNERWTNGEGALELFLPDE